MREPFRGGLRGLTLRLLSAGVALLVSGALVGQVLGQGQRTETRYAVKGVAKDDVLNIRQAPGETQILARIPPNARGIVVLGPRAKSGGGTWAQVRYGAVTGWVNTRFLAPDDVLTASTVAPRRDPGDSAVIRGERFNGIWHQARWSMSIDAQQVALVPVSSPDRPPRLLAQGSKECGTVHDRIFARLGVEEIPATFTDPRFYAWARAAAAQDATILVMIVTCGSPSHRFFFFLAGQQKMLLAEWDERTWLMYEEFDPSARQVVR